jgi:hypothetical protein
VFKVYKGTLVPQDLKVSRDYRVRMVLKVQGALRDLKGPRGL